MSQGTITTQRKPAPTQRTATDSSDYAWSVWLKHLEKGDLAGMRGCEKIMAREAAKGLAA